MSDVFDDIEEGGGAFTLNGKPMDASDLKTALSNEPLDANDMKMIEAELQAALDEMRYRSAPLQAKPENGGNAPTLNFRIPGGHGQGWTIGSKWDRTQPEK
jgi:hypothetical protein